MKKFRKIVHAHTRQMLISKILIIIIRYTLIPTIFSKNQRWNKAKRNGEKFQPEITKEFKEKFFKLVDKVILSLMEDKDNFYGYF